MAQGAVIVTGATGGIGRAIVDRLMERGLPLVLAVRNVRLARELYPRARSVELDLSSLAKVRQAADEILAWEEPIAAIINNAGIMPAQAVTTSDGYELATQVNFVATKLWTQLLIPSVQDGGAIVFTTSVTRCLGDDRDGWAQRAIACTGPGRRFRVYGQSKRLITAYAADLAAECPRLRVNCADPGIVDTNMITMGNRLVDMLSAALFRPIISTAAQGAQAAIRAYDSPASGLIYTKHKQSRNDYGKHI